MLRGTWPADSCEPTRKQKRKIQCPRGPPKNAMQSASSRTALARFFRWSLCYIFCIYIVFLSLAATLCPVRLVHSCPRPPYRSTPNDCQPSHFVYRSVSCLATRLPVVGRTRQETWTPKPKNSRILPNALFVGWRAALPARGPRSPPGTRGSGRSWRDAMLGRRKWPLSSMPSSGCTD